jgi:predicted O-linked N-acetylglucosamine transferase (SPINDLY family)
MNTREALAKAFQHQKAGNLAAAANICRRILSREPRHAEALHMLGFVAHRAGKYSIAVEHITKAIAANPSVAEYHHALGLAYRELGRLDEAITHYRRALALKPDFVRAHIDLGKAFGRQSDPDQAVACFRRALELKPSDGLRIRMATSCLPFIHESFAHLAEVRRTFETNVAELAARRLSLKDPVKEVGSANFLLAYHALDDRQLQVEIADLYKKACPSLSFVAPHCEGPRRRVRGTWIKVGFISRFFTNHTISRLFRGFIAELSRERFSVTVFSYPHRSDAMWEFIRSRADETVVLPTDPTAARQAIASKRLDVLLYTDIGMEPETYFLAFSRLAPVQCATFGHPVTTGIPTIDYFISNESLEPDGADAHYSERLVRLRHVPAYYYRPRIASPLKTRGAFGLEDRGALYLCPQSLFKLHPECDEVLGNVLRADTQGTLLLIEWRVRRWAELLMERFKRTIPDVAGRIRVLPWQQGPDFLGLLSAADVILDPLHWSGGNTTLQALYLGTPIVTLPGAFMRGRFTHGCYTHMGMMDCVAASKEDYVERAVRLGTDRTYREGIKEKLLAANGVLYENRDSVRDLERFLEEAVEKGP